MNDLYKGATQRKLNGYCEAGNQKMNDEKHRF